MFLPSNTREKDLHVRKKWIFFCSSTGLESLIASKALKAQVRLHMTELSLERASLL